MIVDGAYYFNLRIQEYSDFIQPTDLIAFSMKENCGAAGVVFEISFMTTNEKISDLIIQNNEVTIEFGEKASNAKSYKAYISEAPDKRVSADDGKYTISFVATLINMQFYTTRASESVFGTSLDMIKKMASTYIGTNVDAQIDTPSEVEHYWLRSYETGAITMLEAWLHMNLAKTVPLLWIDTKNVVHIKDIDRIKKDGVKARFVPAGLTDYDKKDIDIAYLNDFTPKSYKFATNLVTGKNTIVNISTVESGNDTVHIPETKPDIASTTQVEDGEVGNKVVDSKYQTDNVHNKFMICYYNNKLRLIQLSSHIGNAEVYGFLPNLNICDLVEVIGCKKNHTGRYIVNTKVTYFGLNKPLKTIVALCRDNTNSIEDSAITPKSKVKVSNQQLTDILQSIRTLRRVTVMGTKLLDGTTQRDILGYCKSFKYNALNSFQVYGVPLNLNSSLDLITSMKEIGLKIINSIIDKYIPYPYNMLLHDLVLDGYNFNKLLSKLFYQYAPDYLRELLIEVVGLLDELANLADALHKQNNKQLSDYNYTSGGYSANDNTSQNGNASGSPTSKDEFIPREDSDMPVDYTQQNTENIKEITDEFVENVEGLDIPIPDISLDESESLLPKDELKEAIAEQVVEYLDGQGYLTGVGNTAFLQILLGKKSLDFNTIKLINANIGNMLYARYWGAYNGEITNYGRIEDITDNVITVPDKDLTEDIYVGDSIIIAGTDSSNGTYTVSEIDYDSTEEETTINVLEEINEYADTPVYTYNTLCTVLYVEAHKDYEITGQSTLEDVTIITVEGNFKPFVKAGNTIRITNTGYDRNTAVVERVDYVNGYTFIVTPTELLDKNNSTKNLQLVISIENSTSISKLSNQDFTEYFVKNGFKDIYTTVPCTKIINATKGAKVWIALPDKESDIEFYINSEKSDMDTMYGMDLGLYAPGGAKLLYNVYISKGNYNSNSVTLEVRKIQSSN